MRASIGTRPIKTEGATMQPNTPINVTSGTENTGSATSTELIQYREERCESDRRSSGTGGVFRRIASLVLRVVVLLAAVTGAVFASTGTASAATNPWGGIAQTDVICDSYFHTLTVDVYMQDSGGLQAYRVWFWHEATGWVNPTQWYFHDKGSMTGHQTFHSNAQGENAVYVEYAWYTTNGWSVVGEWAAHRQTWAGMSPTGYYTSCYT